MGSYASYSHEVEHKPLELQRTRRSMDTMGTRAIRCVLGWLIGDGRFDSRQNPAPAMEHKQERSGSISVCVVCD